MMHHALSANISRIILLVIGSSRTLPRSGLVCSKPNIGKNSSSLRLGLARTIFYFHFNIA